MPLILVAAIGLSFFLTGVTIYGMQRGSQNWLQPLLTALSHPRGSFLTRAALRAAAFVVSGVAWVFNEVEHYLSLGASHAMGAIAHWIDGLAGWVTHVLSAVGTLAEDVAHGFEYGFGVTLPRAIHKAVAPVAATARLGLREADLVAHRLRVYARGIDRLLHERILPGLRAVEHAVDVTLPRALGRIRTRVGTLEHELAHPSRAWLKRLARSMWAVALFGLLVRFLVRRFPWLFCRKVSSVGKRLCGLDQDLLNALLLDTVIISGSISVVEFAGDLEAVEGVAVSLMRDFIREL